jgi:hypothetical protein
MKYLVDGNNVVVYKVLREVKKASNGFEVDGLYTFPQEDLKIVDSVLELRVQKDKLVNGKPVPNENYLDIREKEYHQLVVDKVITKEQFKTITGKDFE